MQRFDWPQLLRLGVRQLGLRPAEFWQLSPAELMVMLGREAADAPMTPQGLAALMAAYPDSDERTKDE